MTRKLVVEADGGSRGNPGPAGFGAVVSDAETGEVLAEAAEPLGTATNNVAEYRGLVAGLQAARDVDAAADVEVRMDSKLVVEQMTGNWRVKHPDLKPLAVEANRLAGSLGDVEFTWVPRSRNTHADRLANEAMDAAAGKRRATPTAASSSRPVDGDEADEGERRRTFVPSTLGTRTRTVLVRHGATAASTDGWVNGAADEPLTDVGREQARKVAQALATGERLAAVVSSPLRRARETADVAASVLGLDVREEDDLREVDFGAWEGMTLADVAAKFPAEFERWTSDPTVAPPGGESLSDARRRASRARDKLLARYQGKTVLVVAHGLLLATVVSVALDVPVEVAFRLRLETTSRTAVDWYQEGYARLVAFNDVAHLP